MADVKRLINNRIRKLRKENGLSQEILGFESELHCNHIGAIERGQKNWSIETLIKVAIGLNVEIGELFNFAIPPADAIKMKKSLIEDINISSPETLKILSDLLNGLKEIDILHRDMGAALTFSFQQAIAIIPHPAQGINEGHLLRCCAAD